MSALRAKVAAARLAGALVRASGRGGGTSLPGKLLLALDPHAVGALAGRLDAGTAVISATNGKTTTAAMAAAILEESGHRLVHNTSGANMAGGIASTLIAASGRQRRRGHRGTIVGGSGERGHAGTRAHAGELGLFEVDEFWLDRLVPDLAPRALVLANLFRDQLDRYGELDTIAERWAGVVADWAGEGQLLLNADDPLIADLGRGRDGVSYFGVEDRSVALDDLQHAADSTHCRRCGSPYEYEAVYVGHLGVYRCPSCGNARPRPDVVAREITLSGTRSSAFTLETPTGSTRITLALPGLYNVYNALAAAALGLALGSSLDQIQVGLARTAAAFGRGETVQIGASSLQLLLIKNPAGANEVLRTLTLEAGELELLAVLNDRVADGRDVSWIWDADWELLVDRIGHVTCAGTRAAELALRLKYAGVAPERLEVIPELGPALDHALARTTRLFAVPTYTAMLALRAELAARGYVADAWRADA